MPKILIFILFLVLAVNSVNSQHKTKKGKRPLTVAEAVFLAEKFIADNGYTDLPTSQKTRRLVNESIEWESDPEKILKARHNSLERKAYSISLPGKNRLGWTVGFRYKTGDNELGRAVTMDSYGGNLRVQHKDVLLQKLEKKLNL